MTDKYWIDYNNFIQKVESLTQQSPSYLLNRYTELILSLEKSNGKDLQEFEFELSYESWARVEIQKVFEEETLTENQLFKVFLKNINELDMRMEKYLENYGENKWWENPKFKKINASH